MTSLCRQGGCLWIALVAAVVVTCAGQAANAPFAEVRDEKDLTGLVLAAPGFRQAGVVVIGIDVSSSIQAVEGRLDLEKSLAKALLLALARTHLLIDGTGAVSVRQGEPDPTITVYDFNDCVNPPVLNQTNLSALVQAVNGQLALALAAAQAIDGIKATDHLTWLAGAVSTACSYTNPLNLLAGDPAKPKGALVLFTDREPTTTKCGGILDIPGAVKAHTNARKHFCTQCSTLVLVGIDANAEVAEALGDSDMTFISYLTRPLLLERCEDSSDPRETDSLTVLVEWHGSQPIQFLLFGDATLTDGQLSEPRNAGLMSGPMELQPGQSVVIDLTPAREMLLMAARFNTPANEGELRVYLQAWAWVGAWAGSVSWQSSILTITFQ